MVIVCGQGKVATQLCVPNIRHTERKEITMTSLPLITIVTVTYNDSTRLKQTILSVAAQDYPNIEYLVIDGGSNDNTKDVLQEFHNIIDWSVSEPDSGLFDAMNKGIRHAHGDWMIFMNAGDQFFDPSVLSSLAPQLSRTDGSRMVIGAVEYIYSSGYRRMVRPRKLDLKWGMRFCHQSTLIRTDYQKQNPFILEDGIAADYGFFLRVQKQKATVKYTQQVISQFYVDGISSSDYSSNIAREADLYRRYMGKSSLSFPVRMLYSRIAQKAKSILPNSVIDKILDLK